MGYTYTWEDAVQSLIDDPAQEQLVRDCYFDPPIHQAADRFRSSREWAAVRKVIGPPRGRALDLGAGNGIVSYALAVDGWDTVALEPDPSSLVGTGAIRRLSRDRNTPIEVIGGYGEEISTAESSVDLVVARQVLHHASDLDLFCREVARVLKPGGVLFSYRDHVVDDSEHLDAFFEQHPLHRLYGGECAYPEHIYAGAISGAGLTIERRWRQFDAAFNYAPKSSRAVVAEAASRVLPALLARGVAPIGGSRIAFPAIGRVLSALDHRAGRSIAYLARRPIWRAALS